MGNNKIKVITKMPRGSILRRRRRNRQRLEEMENQGETYLTSRERLEDMEEPLNQEQRNQEFGTRLLKDTIKIIMYLKTL
jgi:hypothetical protein